MNIISVHTVCGQVFVDVRNAIWWGQGSASVTFPICAEIRLEWFDHERVTLTTGLGALNGREIGTQLRGIPTPHTSVEYNKGLRFIK